MLSKKARLSRDDFPKKRATKRYPLSWGAVLVYPHNHFKAAVVVSKKTLKKAHERNRLKRRVYAALESLSTEVLLVKVVVLPRSEALTVPLGALKTDLEHVLGKEMH
ncbi:MAG: ribonuclease P protein component [Patescibacteria group bacterium UBA2163]